MGIHPNSDLQRSPAYSVTPPRLPSPVPAVSLSKASGDKVFGRIAPISPPMSSHEPRRTSDMSPRRGLNMGRDQRESQNDPTRQQLPSLSSLFAAHQHVRPLHSPVSDRPSPMYGHQSPSERPPSASTNPDRPYSSSSSYFPSISPTLNQPRPVYEPRLAVERPTLPSVAQSFPGPLSPPIREYDQAHQAPRPEGDVGRKWAHPGFSDVRRTEYVYNARPSTPTFRPTGDHRVPLPPLGPTLGYESSLPPKMEGRGQPGRPGRSPTSPGSASSEGLLGKDGLGPKIWTGTHFLPRFVRRAEVPGEGLCYFYDDGTHCKTVIDGEPVNAHWGVTKAGKPRKRLAIACLTCREKKIKCDPDYPRCVQCEKFGRVCKFKNAPRGGHNTSPATSPGEQDDSRQLGAPPRIIDLDRPRSVSGSSVSPHTKLGRPSPELPSLPTKRARFSYDQFPPPPTSYPYSMMQTPETKPASVPWPPRELPGIRDGLLYRRWQPEPYVRDPQRTR
ncbi:putative fungal specific transcription factor [Rosellinia necatrix]|uniref:Putative fungal specific transcription factor n=1 Tax=Rosellinia necatrix TaxID=77044 RepID=A0A1S7ULF8_ROSNE|nr:putative fungal specific transcription factor [Rosellinia necatrix]